MQRRPRLTLVTGAPGGLAQADTFLSQWVPAIMAAPAYRDGGLIVITFDEGSDSAACCGETVAATNVLVERREEQ